MVETWTRPPDVAISNNYGESSGLEAARGMKHFMNSSGHLTASHATARRVKKTKAHKPSRGRGRNGKSSSNAQNTVDPVTTMAAVGTLTRTKALLLAALRVWELKHRIHE